MRLLVNIKDLCECPTDNEELYRLVCDEVCGQYPESQARTSSSAIIVLGSDDPKQIQEAARSWNESIKRRLKVAVAMVENSSFALDSESTCSLRRAAMAADNIFNSYGDVGVLIDNGYGFPQFKTVLNEAEIKDVAENTADYALVTFTVYP